MKLKPLAGLVCIAQSLAFVIGIYNATSHHYFNPTYLLQMLLTVPMILFFFYVWKNQKP